MTIIIKCLNCGFIFYKGNKLRDIDVILRLWDYTCPCCLSPIKLKSDNLKIEFKIKTHQERIYSKLYNRIEKIFEQEKCSICDKPISSLCYKTISKIICIKCLYTKLSDEKKEILKQVLKEKFNLELSNLT